MQNSYTYEPSKADLALTDTQLGFLRGLAFAIFYSTLGIPIASPLWRTAGAGSKYCRLPSPSGVP
jgi:hypothetical protein